MHTVHTTILIYFLANIECGWQGKSHAFVVQRDNKMSCWSEIRNMFDGKKECILTRGQLMANIALNMYHSDTEGV